MNLTDIQKAQLMAALRYLLFAAGGWITTHKYMDIGAWEQVSGVLIMLAPPVWSYIDKAMLEKRMAAREVVAVNAGIAAKTSGEVGPTARPADVPEIIQKFSPPVDPAQPVGETK
jgi:hypothetical protein